MRQFVSAYRPSFITTIVYMLQQTEYRTKYYLKWLWRVKDFNKVQKRGQLDRTKAARMLLVSAWLLVVLLLAMGAAMISLGLYEYGHPMLVYFGVLTILTTPVLMSHLLLVPTWIGRIFIVGPATKAQAIEAKALLAKGKWTKIAVAGSYGKTTMKQILATVLGEGKKVAATEGNLNTAIAHYRFAKGLKGKEEVLIVEYGEYLPGDINGFNQVVEPNIGVITGLNEAHLQNFGTIKKTAKNILSLADFVGTENTYINGENDNLVEYAPKRSSTYDSKQVADWKISNIVVKPTSTSFVMKKDKQMIAVKSALIGRHNVGPLAMVAALADKLGLSVGQIEKGLSKTEPFEHRMKPMDPDADVLMIDDTYNGNIDGVRAGTAYLSDIEAKRKIYVTPGLVEQGRRTESVHIEMGELIADVADVVVLMNNSVTKFIKSGLMNKRYKGEVLMVDEPLMFYSQIGQITVPGDVVLMQNDWTDAYN